MRKVFGQTLEVCSHPGSVFHFPAVVAVLERVLLHADVVVVAVDGRRQHDDGCQRREITGGVQKKAIDAFPRHVLANILRQRHD